MTCCMLVFACHSVFIFSSVLVAWIIQILNLILNFVSQVLMGLVQKLQLLWPMPLPVLAI